MFHRRQLKPGYFVLEGLNSFATVYFFYYFYFFMHEAYGFGNRANLLLAAITVGAIYAVVAWQAGKFAERFGYFNALKVGFAVMIIAAALGLAVHSAAGHIFVMAIMVAGMCFTWPTLEALTSEGESAAGLQRMVGIYNVVWAGTAAVAYFTGGAMLEKLGFRSLFYIPLAVELCQLGLTLWLESKARQLAPASSLSSNRPLSEPTLEQPSAFMVGTAVRLAPAETITIEKRKTKNENTKAKGFLRMAWLANPFAYIAITTLIAVIPGVAQRLKLSTMLAGFCCSVWCFSRLGAFLALWLWSGWHYRFRWLLASFVALIATFAATVMAPNLAVLVLAQIVFGAAIGLIYYSSLFYSMDVSDAKGEHGGVHEAAIGVGNFAGPAVGAASLYFMPQYSNSSTFAVSLLLLLGLGGLLITWWKQE